MVSGKSDNLTMSDFWIKTISQQALGNRSKLYLLLRFSPFRSWKSATPIWRNSAGRSGGPGWQRFWVTEELWFRHECLGWLSTKDVSLTPLHINTLLYNLLVGMKYLGWKLPGLWWEQHFAGCNDGFSCFSRFIVVVLHIIHETSLIRCCLMSNIKGQCSLYCISTPAIETTQGICIPQGSIIEIWNQQIAWWIRTAICLEGWGLPFFWGGLWEDLWMNHKAFCMFVQNSFWYEIGSDYLKKTCWNRKLGAAYATHPPSHRLKRTAPLRFATSGCRMLGADGGCNCWFQISLDM